MGIAEIERLHAEVDAARVIRDGKRKLEQFMETVVAAIEREAIQGWERHPGQGEYYRGMKRACSLFREGLHRIEAMGKLAEGEIKRVTAKELKQAAAEGLKRGATAAQKTRGAA